MSGFGGAGASFTALFLSVIGTMLATSAENGNLLVDISKPDAAEAWQTVNDGVMGGVSEGNLRITKDKVLEFSGVLSLENNGGFASVRTKPSKLNLSKAEAFVLRVRGDGRTYYFNVHVPTQVVAFSYRIEVRH